MAGATVRVEEECTGRTPWHAGTFNAASETRRRSSPVTQPPPETLYHPSHLGPVPQTANLHAATGTLIGGRTMARSCGPPRC